MKSLYCPKCSNYLEDCNGEFTDCPCGWTQPASPACDNEDCVSSQRVIGRLKARINFLEDQLRSYDEAGADILKNSERYLMIKKIIKELTE